MQCEYVILMYMWLAQFGIGISRFY